jgi:hypothetical protein
LKSSAKRRRDRIRQTSQVWLRRWGALGKVKHLEQSFPGLREKQRFSGPLLEQVEVQALASAS